MNKPTVVLKNVKTFRGMEGYGLNADVWINGVKSAFVMDDANGGCFNYDVYNKENFKLLEDYLKSLGKYPLEINGEVCERDGKPIMCDHDIDTFINDIWAEQEQEKTKKKIQKLYGVAIVFGTPKFEKVAYVKFKYPLDKLVQIPSHKASVQREIDKIKANDCKNGVVILNDNLKALGLVV